MQHYWSTVGTLVGRGNTMNFTPANWVTTVLVWDSRLAYGVDSYYCEDNRVTSRQSQGLFKQDGSRITRTLATGNFDVSSADAIYLGLRTVGAYGGVDTCGTRYVNMTDTERLLTTRCFRCIFSGRHMGFV